MRLFALSFLLLFVELALIRWTAANNVYLEYFTNFVLLASFLGIGLGFLQSKRQLDMLVWTPVLLMLLVVFVLHYPVSLATLTGPAQLHSALPRWLNLSVIFIGTTAVMAAIGQGVGREFTRFPPLEAYRLDILGSIAGIVVFSVLSFMWLPPIAWGVIASAVLVVVIGPRWQLLALIIVLVLLAVESGHAQDHWSPYYKVTASITPTERIGNVRTHDVLAISANNVPHQTALPVTTLHRIEPFYFFPYRHVPRALLNDVLIVGAGSGNDVAVALASGVKHVDAVEIDPVIQRLGDEHHFNHPYQDPRVHTYISDGRAYLDQTSKHYDLILFALPDSLTLLSGQGNLRLESFLFTLESIRAVKSHLNPGGTFAMYNYYQKFLLSRYGTTLTTVFRTRPCVELGDTAGARQQAVLTSGTGGTRNCATRWDGARVSPPTDDYPFPYLHNREIPAFYWHTLLLILGASLLLIRGTGQRFQPLGRYVDLSLMGAAFLLLETKNVVQFALLFGTTWFVNALVFAGILLSVYLAVEVTRHLRLPSRTVLYLALLAALVTAWAIPPSTLLSLSVVPRFFAAVALAFAPVFFANLIFAQRFRDVASLTTAFAANLLGAMAGGMLEYLSLVTGYRVLLVLIGGLYALAFLAGARERQVAVSTR